MKLLKIQPYDRWDKDIWLGNREVRVDNDDVDPVEAGTLVAMIHVAPEMLDILLDLRLSVESGDTNLRPIYDRACKVLDEFEALEPDPVYEDDDG